MEKKKHHHLPSGVIYFYLVTAIPRDYPTMSILQQYVYNRLQQSLILNISSSLHPFPSPQRVHNVSSSIFACWNPFINNILQPCSTKKHFSTRLGIIFIILITFFSITVFLFSPRDTKETSESYSVPFLSV